MATLYTDMTPSKWAISDAEKRPGNGSMSSWVTTHEGGRAPRCQLIEGTIAFDAGYGVSDDKMTPEERAEKMLKVEMNIDISAPENAALINFCAAVDDRVVDWGVANGQKIFKQAMTKDFAAKLYRSLIKLPAPPEPGQPLKNYLPQFRVKINNKPYITDKQGNQKVNPNKTKIFVATSKTTYKPADTSILLKGCRVLPIVSMSSIWVSAMSFGINVVANEILVWPTDSHSSSAFNFVLPAPMTLVEDVPRQVTAAAAGGAAAGSGDDGDDSMEM